MRIRELISQAALFYSCLCLTADAGDMKPIKECVTEYQEHKAQIKMAGISPPVFFHECWWHTSPGAQTSLTKALPKLSASMQTRVDVRMPHLPLRASWPFSVSAQRRQAEIAWSRKPTVRRDETPAKTVCAVPSRTILNAFEWQSGGAQLHPEMLRQGFKTMLTKSNSAAL